MKVHYECASCYLRQAREALDMATEDINKKMEVTEKINQILCHRFQKGAVSNQIGTEIHRTIKEETGNPDPYSSQRKECNKIALKYEKTIKKRLKEDNSLKNFLKAAITGNVIDFGALGLETNLESLIQKTMDQDLAIDHTPELEDELKKAHNVLYLADNIGEIVYDKLLITKLLEYDVKVTLALKEKPILNDACIPDALDIGLDEVADLTTIGTDSIGVIYEDLSSEFKKLLLQSDLILAKGLGNYEGLDEIEIDKPVFCLLNAKCTPIAREIGVKKGESVVLRIS